MVITVFGLGFVGLTTALGFAQLGHKVYGIESDGQRLGAIASGKLPFLEPGMGEALARHLNGNFIPCGDFGDAAAESDCIYYCVGTPYGGDGQADLSFLYEAVGQTLGSIKDGRFRVLVTKSTVPPSTTMSKIVPFVEERGFSVGRDIGVANNPEFLREGSCWDDFMNADRIVIGTSDGRSEEMLRAVYAGMHAPVFCVSPNTGEFIKYLSNALLATLISYSNEMSLIADAIGGIDVAAAFRILHTDGRWGGCGMAGYAYPGCGYGGYCLPKDTSALYSAAKAAGFDAQILKSVIGVNDGMPGFIARKISDAAGGDRDAVIGILGLSFKPGSDDTRDAPSAKIIRELNRLGYAGILGYDPVAVPEFQARYGLGCSFAGSLEECVERADVLAIATAWPEFRGLPGMTGKKIVDCRYML